MAILSTYESKGKIDGIDYIVFFCEGKYDGWVDAVMFMRDATFPKDTVLWSVGNVQIPEDEIAKFSVAPETGDEDYSTEGWSVTDETLELSIETLRECGFEDGAQMEEGVRAFFGA